MHNLFSDVVRCNGMDMRSNLLVELAQFLSETNLHLAHKGYIVNQLKVLASHCLVEVNFLNFTFRLFSLNDENKKQNKKVFGNFPTCRKEILGLAFNVIAEDPSTAMKSHYCTLLQNIAHNHLVTLTEHLHEIQEWFAKAFFILFASLLLILIENKIRLSYLHNFPTDISKTILSTFVPLVKVRPQFFDFIFMLLRKLLVSKQAEAGRLGIYGMCVLLQYSTDPNAQTEIISSLKPAFNYPLEVREHLYNILSSMLHSERFSKQVSTPTLFFFFSLSFFCFLGVLT
jgi:hypothetical protein